MLNVVNRNVYSARLVTVVPEIPVKLRIDIVDGGGCLCLLISLLL